MYSRQSTRFDSYFIFKIKETNQNRVSFFDITNEMHDSVPTSEREEARADLPTCGKASPRRHSSYTRIPIDGQEVHYLSLCCVTPTHPSICLLEVKQQNYFGRTPWTRRILPPTSIRLMLHLCPTVVSQSPGWIVCSYCN